MKKNNYSQLIFYAQWDSYLLWLSVDWEVIAVAINTECWILDLLVFMYIWYSLNVGVPYAIAYK